MEMHRFLLISLLVCGFQKVFSQVTLGNGLGNGVTTNRLGPPNNFGNGFTGMNLANGIASNNLPYSNNLASNFPLNNGLTHTAENIAAASIANTAANVAAIADATNAAIVNNAEGLNSLSIAGMPISGVSSTGFGDVAIGGTLPVDGLTAVSGNVPVIGYVTFEGIVPAGGTVTLASNCGNNQAGQ